MNTRNLRRAVVPGIAVMALALSACSASNESEEPEEGGATDGGSSEVEEGSLSGEYIIGGASSQEAAQLAWVTGFQELQPEVTLTYEPQGSGAGRENFISEGYLIGASDAYLEDDPEADQPELTGATERCGGTPPIEFPSYISPIAIIFNVEGVDELNLAPATLAGIFAGEITTWDAPEIAADNPDATLPSAPINAVHRSDESGTTDNFTNYLDLAAGDVWTEGALEVWPQQYGGEGAAQTSGMISAVRDGQNSIGYADASQAGSLGVANIGVGEDFVAPTPEAAAQILAVSPIAEGAEDNQLIYDLDYTTAEAGTYPITLTSYMLACETYADAAEADVVKAYLSYIISDEGQEFAAEEAGSAPLSDELQEQAQTIVDSISAG